MNKELETQVSPCCTTTGPAMGLALLPHPMNLRQHKHMENLREKDQQ